MGTDDTLLLDDWHPVAAAAAVAGTSIVPARLLGRDLALWRDAGGTVHAWEDRCPHRGTRFTVGEVRDGSVACRYHGWRFAADGRCTAIPALPGTTPPGHARARAYRTEERYGLVWACVGEPDADVPDFEEADDVRLRKVVCGPYDVATSGPRIVENFLDMAHFAFVHDGILGDEEHAEVPDCDVAPIGDDAGLLATRCYAWQPRSNSLADEGSRVEYTYRVVRPLTAILTKVPAQQQDYREAISLHVQPVAEEASRAWMVLAMTNFSQSDADLRGFQDRIFLQDRPVLEQQVPLRLPLDPAAELSMRCDRMSIAYRRYLARRGLRYGVIA